MKFGVSSGHRAEPPPPAEQAMTADAAKIGSLPLKSKLRVTNFFGIVKIAELAS